MGRELQPCYEMRTRKSRRVTMLKENGKQQLVGAECLGSTDNVRNGDGFELERDVYLEIEEELEKTGKSPLVHYIIEEKKRLVRTYLQEAKWEYSGYIPTLEEYMKVGKPSSTYLVFISVSLTAIGELASKEAFEWVASEPLILQGLEEISRLMNDLVGFGFEQKISAVGCYMNQNNGASKEEAFVEIQKQVTNAWKVINQECLHPTAVPMAFLEQVIDLLSILHVSRILCTKTQMDILIQQKN